MVEPRWKVRGFGVFPLGRAACLSVETVRVDDYLGGGFLDASPLMWSIACDGPRRLRWTPVVSPKE